MHTGIDTSEAAWAGKTYGEITAIGERSGSVLVVPVGSVEQHGHHMPVATDTILVDAIAHLGAERVLDDVPILVTPPVWTGYSPHHLSLGGTMSLEFETLRELLEETVDTALENGFDAVLLLNGHGGNMSLVDGAVSTIGVEHPDVEVLGLTYFELAEAFIHDVRDSETGGMAHAGEFETSLMLYLKPELVGEQRDAEYWDEHYDRAGKDLLEGGPLGVYRTFEEYSASGAIGAPELASPEKGEEIFERLGDELEAVLREIYAHNE